MPSLGLGLGLHRHAGASWTPARLPTLAGWWRAEDALTAVGPDTPASITQTIRRIPDRSGNGRHMDQATGNAQPILDYFNGVDSSNGLAMVFDGVDDLLATSAFSISTARTIAMLVYPESEGIAANISPSWDINGGGTLAFDDQGILTLLSRGGGDYLSGITEPSFPVGTQRVVVLQQANQRGNVRLWVDGVEAPLTLNSNTDGSDFNTANNLNIAGRGLFNIPLKGRIAEALLCDGHLSPSELAALNSYFPREYRL